MKNAKKFPTSGGSVPPNPHACCTPQNFLPPPCPPYEKSWWRRCIEDLNMINNYKWLLNQILSIWIIVGCYDLSSTMMRYKQQYVSGQILVFPAINSTIYYLECMAGFNWTDGGFVKSIRCSNDKWGRIPSPCKCTLF